MSIRLIAKELYRTQQEVEKLQDRMESAPYQEKDALRDELRKKKAELQRLRNIMAGAKSEPVRSFKPKG